MPPPPARRPLRFSTIDDALAEATHLATAERDNRLTHTGHWSLGTALHHCATWADLPFTGYPDSVHAPLPIRLLLRLLRNRILTHGMTPGVRIRTLPAGTLATDPHPTPKALDHFRTAFQRLQQTCPTLPNPVFGPLTHPQWIQLNLRHAELHLSFQHPTP